jgi:Transcriptional regulator/sugar kinase
MKKILVVDIGGTNVKVMLSRAERRKFQSGLDLTARSLLEGLRSNLSDWRFDAVSVGFPAPVRNGRLVSDPKNLGPGWTRFNFEKAFKKPVRLINDAAMQALGSYRGGRMLFIGLGTGFGSALVWKGTVLPLELGELPYLADGSVEDRVGKNGLKRLGRKLWQQEVRRVVTQMQRAFVADYVVLGGGNAKLLDRLPPNSELGHNRNAYLGGCRLWQQNSRTRRPRWTIL